MTKRKAEQVNRVMLIGNLGRDPESRTTNAGDKVVSFSLATSDRWKDKATGERKENTTWHNIVIFNQALCGIVEQFCKKGSKIYIEGKLQTREFEDRDGTTRKMTEVVLSSYRGEIELLDSKPAPRDRAAEDKAAAAAPMQGDPRGTADLIDDDIPFALIGALLVPLALAVAQHAL